MIGASGLSGDTLIACSFPVVPLPTWQLPVQALCGSAKRAGRLSPVGLTRAVSLPERDSLDRDQAFAGGGRQFSSSYCSLNEDRGEEEGASDSSGRYDSTSSPEETGSRPKENPGTRGGARSRNSFLPNPEMDEEEEDDDSDGGNLHGYHEDSAFVLQGNSNWTLGARTGGDSYQLEQVGSEWVSEGTVLGPDGDRGWLSNQPGRPSSCQRRRGSPESYPRSDSSCNSSDGILVNFCSMYDRSNNPATPQDLTGPSIHPSGGSEGSVFLSLQPVSPSGPPTPCWSPRGLDSNCNLYSRDELPQGLSSLELSDLTACLQSQASWAMGTNQKYYKLVTCDLSSQSPSPAWSSNASCPEAQSKTGPLLDLGREGRAEDLEKEGGGPQEKPSSSSSSSVESDCSQASGRRAAPTSTSTLKALRKQKHTDGLRNISGAISPAQALLEDPEEASSLGNEAAKPQRPTSLPIQPFVLVPTGREATVAAAPVGGLLEHYLNRKSNKAGSSQPGSKFKGRRSRCFSSLQLSPMGSHYPVFLEPPSSSDTSSSTPSPEWSGRRHTWSQSSRAPGRLSPRPRPAPSPGDASPRSEIGLTPPPSHPTLVKIPTYQDLNNLTPKLTYTMALGPAHTSYHSTFPQTPPTLPISAHSDPPSPERPPPPPPAADRGFFHAGLTAALSSVAPLSSLSSLLSFRTGQPGEPLVPADKPPAEFCPSPDASYESMSISHLQRRGLLRSVSRAVDLIMAHFGSSRDPDEKMRLGNSSRSPTIAGLVLEHLCPSIQNILEDGLRDHKLDLIIGQRRNHPWSVVEVSTTVGPSTKVLHRLVCKIRACPQLLTHCMRLRAFVMGLLNLRALEFWLAHLHSQKDVVAANYHSWGFMSMSLGRCQPLFQELLLLLQPLSVLPFDLNLLLEPRLLGSRQLGSDQDASPPPPSSGLLATGWPLLQADRGVSPHRESPGPSGPRLAPILERGPVQEEEDCGGGDADNWSQISVCSQQEERRGGGDAESPPRGVLRWAKLFGAADSSPGVEAGAQSRRRRRPSEWLRLDGAQVGTLVRSIRSIKLNGAQADRD